MFVCLELLRLRIPTIPRTALPSSVYESSFARVFYLPSPGMQKLVVAASIATAVQGTPRICQETQTIATP